MAINANTTTQVPNREIHIPEKVTGGQCDNSTLYSHHGDDVTDSNSVPVFSYLNDSVYSHHDDDVTDSRSVPMFSDQAALNDDSVHSHHDDDVTESNSVPVFSDQAALNGDSVYSHHGDDVTDSNSAPVSTDQAVLTDDWVYSHHDGDVNDSNSVPVSTGHGVGLNESISPGDAALDTIPYLDTLRTKYPRNLFIAHLNVNRIRYKFYEIHDILNGNRIDIFGISETKIDASFTDAQFCVEGFKLYRQDRNAKGNGGGIFVYIKDSIPHRILKTHSGITNAIEYMSFEVCFKRRTWFLVYMYKPPKVSDESAWSVLSQLADNFVDSSKLAIFFGDINHDMFKDNILHDLCDVYDLKNVIRGPTCFKGENPTLLDVFLTNKPSSFCNCINIDTGISDFHNLTGVISKLHAPQANRRRITYRSMKHFDHEDFNRDLSNVPFHVCDIFDDVDDIAWAQQHLLSSVINIHAPLKQRYLRANQVPYMNGQLRKAIHQRNMWRNKHFKDKRDPTARANYVRCRNNVVKLTKLSVNTYFKNKCESCHGNSKQFFKTVKPFLSNNSNNGSGNKILLNENGKIVSDASEVAEIFNTFYGSIAGYPVNCEDGLNDISPIDALNKHCMHDSVINIKLHMGVQATNFDFNEISTHDILEKIKSLKTGKSPGYDGIQVKFLKLADANLAGSLCMLFNKCVQSCTFPSSMKMADISPIYKKLDNLCKNNYRSVNLLPVLSKLFESIMAEQLTTYFEHILSPLLSAYRKGYSCQHVILRLTELWRNALDNNKYVGTVAMDLSKAFDCMPHGLLLAKLHSYGVSSKACLFLSNYLRNRMQRVKVMDACSDWTIVNRGVPQGSVLGPLLFNIFLNDLFFLPLNSHLVNYADDNHICLENENLDVLQKQLQDDSNIAVRWFNNNQTTANPDKFQSIILSRDRVDQFDISLDGHVISRGNSLKMLGVTLDDNLNFNEHVRNICQTASCQINALKRISNFLNEQCRMNVYKSFISANFNYCPIVWLFCGKTNLNKLEKLQERALATVFCDNSLTYEDMLEKSGQLRIRLNLIRLVAIDMFKCMNDLNPLYINEMFIGKDSGYNLRDQSRLLQPKFNTKRYGYRSFKYFGSKVWNCLPPCVKNVNDLSVFKKYLYNWCLTDHAKKLLEQLEL